MLGKRTVLAAALLLIVVDLNRAARQPKPPALQREKIILIMRTEGVRLTRKGKTTGPRMPAYSRFEVRPGTTIKTGRRSRGEVHIGKLAVVRLQENTVFQIKKQTKRGRIMDTLTRLIDGKVLVKARKGFLLRSRFRLQTPTAVMAVRGTEFVVEAGKAETTVRVLEGVVDAAKFQGETPEGDVAQGEASQVSAGQEIDVAEGQDPSQPEDMSPEEIQEVRAWGQQPELETVMEEELALEGTESIEGEPGGEAPGNDEESPSEEDGSEVMEPDDGQK